MNYEQTLHEYVFGVFRKGKMVIMIGKPIKCSDLYAKTITGVLDLAEQCLEEGDYFACDYKENIKPWKKEEKNET